MHFLHKGRARGLLLPTTETRAQEPVGAQADGELFEGVHTALVNASDAKGG